MREIELSQGRVAVVDDKDYDYLSQWNWVFNGRYAIRTIKRKGQKAKTLYMHRVILDPLPGFLTDHINGDRLDNRRDNLRAVTNQQNGFNRRLQKNISGYKGVHWNKNERKYMATIKCNGIQKHLGYFLDPLEAARTYNQAATQLFGEFARLNDVKEDI